MNLLETTRIQQATTESPALPHQVDWDYIQQQVNKYGYIYQRDFDNFITNLTPAQQEENLLYLALWVVERDLNNFDMGEWHADEESEIFQSTQWSNFLYKPECGTRHCIAGFAQVMSGCRAFDFHPLLVGMLTLGSQNKKHFLLDSLSVAEENLRGLNFLHSVISNSCTQTKQGI